MTWSFGWACLALGQQIFEISRCPRSSAMKPEEMVCTLWAKMTPSVYWSDNTERQGLEFLFAPGCVGFVFLTNVWESVTSVSHWLHRLTNIPYMVSTPPWSNRSVGMRCASPQILLGGLLGSPGWLWWSCDNSILGAGYPAGPEEQRSYQQVNTCPSLAIITGLALMLSYPGKVISVSQSHARPDSWVL